MKERGSLALDHLFSRADSQKLRVAFSTWNIGEVMGVLNKRYQRRDLTRDEFSLALQNFASDVPRMMRTGSLELLPVSQTILTESLRILLEEHIYQADALQIASCMKSASELFVAAEESLVRAAKKQGLKALNPEKEEESITAI